MPRCYREVGNDPNHIMTAAALAMQQLSTRSRTCRGVLWRCCSTRARRMAAQAPAPPAHPEGDRSRTCRHGCPGRRSHLRTICDEACCVCRSARSAHPIRLINPGGLRLPYPNPPDLISAALRMQLWSPCCILKTSGRAARSRSRISGSPGIRQSHFESRDDWSQADLHTGPTCSWCRSTSQRCRDNESVMSFLTGLLAAAHDPKAVANELYQRARTPR